jgi:streptogramin lyase
MKLFRLVIPILAGLLMAITTLVAFARATPAPANPPPPNASETDLLPSGDAENIHADATGKLWITEIASSTVREFDPATRAYTLYTGLARPRDAQLGPDGKLWWLENEPTAGWKAVARMDLSSRLVTTWPVTASSPVALAFDNSNRAWFVDQLAPGAYRFDPNGNQYCDYALPGGGQGGPFIAAHNGALWLSDQLSTTLGRITPTAGLDAAYTYWPLSFGGGFPEPHGVTFAPNGGVWWADGGLHKIGFLQSNTNRMTLFGPPGLLAPQQVDYQYGKVWFTDPFTNSLGFIDPETAVGIGPQLVTPTMTTLSPDCATVGSGTYTAGMSTGVASFSPFGLTSSVDPEGTLYQVPGSGEPFGLTLVGFDLWTTDIAGDNLMHIDTAAAHLYLPLMKR